MAEILDFLTLLPVTYGERRMTDADDLLPLDRWMVAWTPAGCVYDTPAGAIEVGPWPDRTCWSDDYAFTMGCCMANRHKMSKAQKVMMMFIDFHTAVTRDGIDPQAAHREFLKIGEYRWRISPDIPGAFADGSEF
jgi:hypothetical protein